MGEYSPDKRVTDDRNVQQEPLYISLVLMAARISPKDLVRVRVLGGMPVK